MTATDDRMLIVFSFGLTVGSHPGRGQRTLERSARDVADPLVMLEAQVGSRNAATERPLDARG
jgi:hypothetical protein